MMIDHAAHDDTGFGPAQALHMPEQVPPVDRNEAIPAADLDSPGVQASMVLGRIPGLDDLISSW
ncbi:hypothetical protein ACWHLZ_29085 [Streptomyces chartreusis]